MYPHRILPCLFAGWLAVSADAAPIVINNPGFEALTLAEDATSVSVPAGWTGAGPGIYGLFNPAEGGSFFSSPEADDGGATHGSIGAMDGKNAVFANGAMSLTQTTGEAVVVGEQYTLTVAIGHRDKGGFGFGGYTIELLDGDSSLASASSNVSPGAGTFTDVTLSYTALAGDSGNLRVRLSHNGNATVTEFDNVRLTSGTNPPLDPLTVSFPPSRYLVQRTASDRGDIPIIGTYNGGAPDRIEARAVVSTVGDNSGTSSNWQVISAAPTAGTFSGTLQDLAAGGWYTLEVRSVTGTALSASVTVEKVGVGDIYVIAGQSNAGSYGSPQATPADDRVSRMTSIASGTWTKASDPMSPPDGLGGDGGSGSAWTRLGDLLTAMDDVPVGFVCIAVGGSGSFEWLPGTTYHTTRLRPVAQHFPSNGFRAVLWHQGEGDAFYQATANLYATQMAQIIAQSRTDAGWDVPWYVCEASAVGGTNNFKGIPVLAGQRATVFADSNVFLGPTTNEFFLEQKTHDGTHFNAAGLLDHATQWRDILGGNTSLDVENHDFERNVTPAITGAGALADGAFYTIDHNAVGDPSILDWRELSASGVVKPDGDTGYYNPGSSQYANAVDTNNGGVMANMDGKHVAFLAGGSAGNHVLQYRRKELLADHVYTLTVALGVRDGGSDVFGGARIEILANGQVLGTGKTVTEADLDTLAGGSARGKFTDVTFEFTTAGSVAGSQPVGVRIIKIDGGAGTYLDFDNVRLTASPVVPDFLLNPMVGSITETGAAASAELAGAATDVSLFWAIADYGTNLAAWQTNGSSDILGNLSAGTVNGSLTGLTADTVYALRFYAVNTALDPAEEEWSAPVTFGTPFATGQKVADLAATALAHNQIALTWSDAFDTEEEYRIERSEDGTNWSSIATLPPDTTGFTDTGLSELTTYRYRILASSTQSGDSDWSNVAQATTPATPSSSIIFIEDFESPVGDRLEIPAGATTFDNPVVAAVTPNSSGWSGRMQQTEAGLSPFSGNQFYEMNGGWAIDSSILFEVAAANTLTNGSTLTVSLYSAGAFSDTVDETFDVILSGGAVGTQSAVSDGPQDVWQQHTFNFIVTDATQAVNLEILATRNSTFDEDLLIDLITVTSEVGNDFSAWIAGFPVGGLTGFNDDFDLDGLANGIENFFGTNPGVANTGLTGFSSDGTSFTFQHPQNATPASDVTGSYQWSPDLENWHNSGDMVGGTVVTITPGLNDPVAGTTTVTAAASGTIPTRLFVRVKVRQTM